MIQKNSRLGTWRFVRLWPIVFRRCNMMEKYNSLSHRDKITQTVIVWLNKWWNYRLKPLVESSADSPSSSPGHPGRKSPVKTTRRSIQDTSKLIPAGLRQYCKTGLFSRQATWQLFFTLLDWCSFSSSYYI